MTSPDQYPHTTGTEIGGQPGFVDLEAIGSTALTGFEVTDTQSQPPTIEDLLSPEQRDFAGKVVTGMTETLGLNPEEIRFVMETTEQGNQIVAIDASPNGQYIGIYKSILEQRQADPDWYTLNIDGQRIDPLAGCTEAAYRAMIADARARGEKFLPDSLALNQHNGHVWTATMITGDLLPEPDKVLIGSSSGGAKVNFIGQPINRGGKSLRVRPAVAVGLLKN